MKLEDQVCSLEQAKKLKSLGVAQSSIFRHASESDGEGGWIDVIRTSPPKENKNFHFAAFTVAELGAMLPNGFCSGNGVNSNKVKWCDKVSKDNLGFDEIIPCTVEDTEAKAKAAMLIYLLERNLTTVEEVNARLAA